MSGAIFRALTFAALAPFVGVAVAATAAAVPARAAEWQFSVPAGQQNNGRAFLWIPPTAREVRGVIVGQQVILEKVALESPRIRAAAAAESLAIVLITPAVFRDFDEKGGGRERLDRVLGDLARVSGYTEIARAPLLPIGHSGGAIPAWNLCYANPARCFGLIGLKAAPIHPPAYAPMSNVDGVPVLVVSGQYETWNNPPGVPADYHWRWVRGTLLEFRAVGRAALMSELVDPGVTHFGWNEDLADYLGMFIRKAAERRIPRRGSKDDPWPRLLDIAPESSGWLAEPAFFGSPRYPAAPVRSYRGDPSLAFWHLDEELARANAGFVRGGRRGGKRLQMITFEDENGRPIETAWLEQLKFVPEADGMTVKVKASFLEETPPGMSFPKKTALGHSRQGPIRFKLLGGWSGGGEQTGPDTFRIRFDRFGLTKPSGSMIVLAYHEGDAEFAYAEQAAEIRFPFVNKDGRAQAITFEAPADVNENATEIELRATSDADLPVEFAVIAGPAELTPDGRRLKLTAIPPRAAFPLKVTVAAYQWGRAGGRDPVRSAAPVLRDFLIVGK